jgi:hypothetical protein
MSRGNTPGPRGSNVDISTFQHSSPPCEQNKLWTTLLHAAAGAGVRPIWVTQGIPVTRNCALKALNQPSICPAVRRTIFNEVFRFALQGQLCELRAAAAACLAECFGFARSMTSLSNVTLTGRRQILTSNRSWRARFGSSRSQCGLVLQETRRRRRTRSIFASSGSMYAPSCSTPAPSPRQRLLCDQSIPNRQHCMRARIRRHCLSRLG